MRISTKYVISSYRNDTELAHITYAHIPLVKTYSLNSLRDMGKSVPKWAVCAQLKLMDCCLLVKAEEKNDVEEWLPVFATQKLTI